MTQFNINLPESIFLRNVAGKAISCKPAEFEAILGRVCEVGIKTILTNVYNGEGKDATETERLAKLEKKLDAWKRGEFVVVERGESSYTPMREVFISDCVRDGLTVKQAEQAMRDAVTERLGKDAKATFSNYLDATAAAMAEGDEFDDAASAREALEGYYAAEAEKRAAAAAKVSAKVKVPTLDLSAFKKTATK